MPRPSVGDEVTADLIDELTYKPVTQLEQQAAQSISSATDIVLTFGAGSEVFDDEGWHDTSTNTSRITPNIAGRYEVTAFGVFAANTVITASSAFILKNGTVISRPGELKSSTTNNTAQGTTSVRTFADCNGNTDYIEMGVLQRNAGATAQNTNAAASGRSTLIVKLHSRT